MERLTGVVQPYAWGSPSVIPDLLGVEPTGEPQAELWLGAHPSAPATIAGRPLDQLVAADPEGLVGGPSVARFGPRLPYLLKVLAMDKPLSLQAHPSREQAEAGYAREQAAGLARDAPERIYRDGWPKPEVLCALSDTEALCGFRDPAQTYDLFARLGVPTALGLVEPLRCGGAEAVEAVFGRLLRLSGDDLAVVDEVARAAAGVRGDGDGDLGLFAATATELADHSPRDPGVLAALLMNRLHFGRHEALYLPAGNLHAYLRGSGVELMANSDNVLRGGLTPKHVGVEDLLSVLDFTPAVPRLVPCTEEAPGVWRYATPAPEFVLWRVEPGGSTPTELPGAGHGRVALATEGAVTLANGGDRLALSRGQAVFLRPAEQVAVTGEGIVFLSGPGI